ncbi:hypothetical protein L7F22_022987 [Adiantum nelumboides]|nr:hypothetical protein [Adiantum nelumboides]
MTAGLEEVQRKLVPFLEKVKKGESNSNNGLSYLDSKQLLLMFYCQSLVFYILLKANGRSVVNHPVVARLIEIRLYLEKIRPIDKKLHYQIEKLLKLATGVSGGADNERATVPDDLLYKPNPDMLAAKIDENNMGKDAIYRPPMIAPTIMDDERIPRDKKFEFRARKDALRKASRSSLVKEIASELEGRPEEIKEFIGHESKEMTRELSRLEARAQQEENLFARVPLSRVEKKKLKHLKRSRNGLMGMLDDFDDDISYLVNMEENKRGGTSSREPDSSTAQVNEQWRNPKRTTTFKKQKGLSVQGSKSFKSFKRRK